MGVFEINVIGMFDLDVFVDLLCELDMFMLYVFGECELIYDCVFALVLLLLFG